MSTRKLTGPSIFLRNAAIVMAARGWKISTWAGEAGMSTRALRKYLKSEQLPGLEALSALAESAGITVSEFMNADLTIEMVRSGELGKLSKNYAASMPRAREHAQKVLTDDLEYQKTLPRPREGNAAQR